MNEATQQIPSRGAAKPIGPAIKPDPKETAQEAVHQVMPKEAAKKLVPPVPAKKAVDPPLKAAKGDDDLMSQPPQKPVRRVP